MKKEKFNKRYLLLLIVTIIVIAFAYLITDLVINGNVTVGANTWDVHFENVEVDESSNIEAISEPTIIGDTEVNYELMLEKPSDKYVFTVDVVNDGSIDAKIDSIGLVGLDEAPNGLVYDIKYDTDEDLAEGDLLAANETKTLKVTIYYDLDINASDLLEENQTLDLTFSLDYTQAD